jgi:hypothetical protein
VRALDAIEVPAPPAAAERYTHKIKSWPTNFRAAVTGRKRFEIRRDDRPRPYQSGDAVLLLEFDPGTDEEGPRGYTGRQAMFFIGWVERSAALPAGWCGFELISPEDLNRVSLAVRL